MSRLSKSLHIGSEAFKEEKRCRRVKSARMDFSRWGALFLIFMFSGVVNSFSEDSIQWVNPQMGVIKAGNVVIGPQLPWGSVNPSPDTPDGYTSGYNPNREIRGFSQLHVSGTGGPGKYGQFLISPQIGLQVDEAGHDSPKADEEPSVSSYKVRLKRYNILCAFTPTRHAALYRFNFPASDDANLLLDLGHNIPKDSDFFHGGYADEGQVFVDIKTRKVWGWADYWGGWSAEPFRAYFAAEFDQSADGFGTWKDGSVHSGQASENVTSPKQRIGCYLKFKTTKDEPILLKIAVSFKSLKQAQTYLDKEIPDWDFSQLESTTEAAWEKQLDKIQIEGATLEQKTVFYSSLYNALKMPRDRSGDNPKWESREPYWDDQYCVWDTWRTLFPLQILINESMVRDNLMAFCDRFQHNGQVSDAFIAGNDRFYEWHGDDNKFWLGNQGGDDVDNLIADAYVKGVNGVKWEDCYKIIKHDADIGRAPAYRVMDRGWVPYRDYNFGLYCSRSVEFAYNDFCAAEVAEGLGKTKDAARYLRRSQQWTNLWDAKLCSDEYKGFLAPRTAEGNFVASDPKSDHAIVSEGDLDRTFYEGSSWIYSYFVPHDFARLVALTGGNETYCAKLRHAMSTGSHEEIEILDECQPTLAHEPGLVDFGNEPSFMTTFSFIYGGRPDLTSYWVRKNIANYTPTGFPGDEDSGAMGSWLVFAAMGLFPNAGQDLYLLSGPIFPKITLTRENGKKIIIEGIHASPENIYIQSATLDGQPLNRAWLRHEEIKDGATLRFVMGPQPSEWGSHSPPPSLSAK